MAIKWQSVQIMAYLYREHELPFSPAGPLFANAYAQ